MLVTKTTQARESTENPPFLVCPFLWIQFVHFIILHKIHRAKYLYFYHAFQRYCLWAHRAIISSGIFLHKWAKGEERKTYRQRTGGRRRDKQDVTHLRQVHSCSRLQRRHHTEDKGQVQQVNKQYTAGAAHANNMHLMLTSLQVCSKWGKGYELNWNKKDALWASAWQDSILLLWLMITKGWNKCKKMYRKNISYKF